MQKLRFVNANGDEIDFTDFENFGVTSWDGLDKTNLDVQSQTSPFQDGSVFLDAVLQDRDLSFTVCINDKGNLEKRYELKRFMIHVLNPKLGEGTLFYTNDYLSMKINAVPDVPSFPTKNLNNGGTLKASVSFTACNPYWEDIEETSLTVTNHNTVIVNNESDFPLNVKMSIDGDSENPSIYNLTNQNSISLRGNFSNLGINSLFGKKSVTSTENRFAYNAGKFKMIVANDLQLMMVSNSVTFKNIFGDTNEFLNFTNNSQFIDMVFSEYFGLYIGVKVYTDSETGYAYVDVYTSSDGLTWNHKRVLAGYSGYPSKICVDDFHGKILILNDWYSIVSTDCVNWELHNISTSINVLTDCVYCNNLNLFIAVGNDGSNSYALTSPDGTEWTRKNAFTTDWFATSIAYSDKNGIIVVVGSKGNYAVSSDGTTWTGNVTGSNHYWSKIRYVDEINKFVAVGKNGLVSISVDGGRTDSVNVIDTGYNFNLTAVTSWKNNLTIYANDENGNMITSIDGQNWTDETNGINLNITSMAYSEKLNLFVAVGLTKALITSSDGKTWFNSSIELPYNLYSIAWSDELELFVAVGENGLIYDSSDGVNWNRQINELTQSLWSVRWIPEIEKFIIMGEYNFLLSSDGMNWDSVSPEGSSRIAYSSAINTNIIFANGKLYATDFDLSGNVDIVIFVSDDEGLSWTRQTISRQNHNSIHGHIYFSPERNLFFILGGFTERISTYNYDYYLCLWTSTDGVTWDEKRFTSGDYHGSQLHHLVDCVKKGNLYLAISNRGEIFSSSDIFNWSQISYFDGFDFGTMILVKDSVYIGGYHIILNSKNKIINSIDSLTSNSNMDFKLDIGNNEIFYVNKINSDLKISFRKKYLGV